MTLVFATHERCLDHLASMGHPERPSRLAAVVAGIRSSGLEDAVVPLDATPASRDALLAVHPAGFVDALAALGAAGGGRIDDDTAMDAASWDAALLAAGAGLDAIAALGRGEGDAAFCAIRPPGHHATPTRAMGFCLMNNVAIAAASLAARGERVAIVDIDAHHGNGTQAVFEDRADVLFVSLHEYPLYPGTGRLDEIGRGAGRGATINVPLPAGATGDVYLDALDRVVVPAVERFGATWLLVSAGFDAHVADPLTGLALRAGDVAGILSRLLPTVPPGRRVLLLEGGYDLDALSACAAVTVAACLGEAPVVASAERATSGGPGRTIVDAVVKSHPAVSM
jgi:acetoin utilization deacetylase AcuC-like enzyme